MNKKSVTNENLAQMITELSDKVDGKINDLVEKVELRLEGIKIHLNAVESKLDNIENATMKRLNSLEGQMRFVWSE